MKAVNIRVDRVSLQVRHQVDEQVWNQVLLATMHFHRDLFQVYDQVQEELL